MGPFLGCRRALRARPWCGCSLSRRPSARSLQQRLWCVPACTCAMLGAAIALLCCRICYGCLQVLTTVCHPSLINAHPCLKRLKLACGSEILRTWTRKARNLHVPIHPVLQFFAFVVMCRAFLCAQSMMQLLFLARLQGDRAYGRPFICQIM